MGAYQSFKVTLKIGERPLLFNIVDNLIPEDSIKLLENILRIATNGAKALIKLTPFNTKEQIECGAKGIRGRVPLESNY